MATSLTLVDVALEPEMIYNILDALYDDTYNNALDNLDAINYLEARLLDNDLPLERETYEETIKSPEYSSWREFNIFEDHDEPVVVE
jgi:hypothetical protein